MYYVCTECFTFQSVRHGATATATTTTTTTTGVSSTTCNNDDDGTEATGDCSPSFNRRGGGVSPSASRPAVRPAATPPTPSSITSATRPPNVRNPIRCFGDATDAPTIRSTKSTTKSRANHGPTNVTPTTNRTPGLEPRPQRHLHGIDSKILGRKSKSDLGYSGEPKRREAGGVREVSKSSATEFDVPGEHSGRVIVIRVGC